MTNDQIPVTKEVITWARARAGYSLEEARKSFKKIDSWEAGEAFPTYPQLEQLAEKFKLPLAVFFFPKPPKLPDIEESFRTLPGPQFAEIPRRVQFLLRKAKALQLNLSELNQGKNPADRVITQDLGFDLTEPIEEMVTGVREYLGITLDEQIGWPNVESALEKWRQTFVSAGVFVFKDAFKADTYSGFCLYDDEFPIVYVNNTSSKARQVFTLFHELAHLLFRTSGIDTLSDDFISDLPADAQKIERTCNKFAAQFLVPDDGFEAALSGLEPNEEAAEQLAATFHVSRELIFRKFLDRDWITQEAYQIAAQKWAGQKKPGGGGDYYNTQMAYLGSDYIRLALSQYHQNRIDAAQLSEYLNIAPKNLETFEERFARRGA